MSLLIKALRQAEKQNQQAARQAAEVAIDLPPQDDTERAQPERSADQSPLSSALSLAVEAHTTHSATSAKPTVESTDFPSLDEDFAPTSGWQDHVDSNQDEDASQAKLEADGLVKTDLLDSEGNPGKDAESGTDSVSGRSSPLTLEETTLTPFHATEEAPPESFARHLPATPPTPGPEQAPTPEEPAPTKPERASSDEPATEAAPYLDVSAALPKRSTSGSPATVIAGLTAMAVLVAAATAGIMWWSGDQAYDTDINAPIAQVTPPFAANDEPLSPLDLGVAVSGTADATSTVGNPTDVVDKELTPASELAQTATSGQNSAQTTPGTDNIAQVNESEQAPAIKTDSAATSVQQSPAEPATEAPAPRPSGTTAAANIPVTTSRPALPSVRFVRSTSRREQSQQLLNDAYDALQRNELTRAQLAYQQALRIDRNLIDGWVGLASVVARQGNSALAAQHYQRALNIDPNDRIARAGLLALAGANLSDESESTLRTLIDASDQNAMAELALGNTLARQGRWAEAQQAYFNANAAQPNQPDIVFNLAVSLDRIRQSRAALAYYEQALSLSENNKAMFDRALVRQRIDSIKQQLREQ